MSRPPPSDSPDAAEATVSFAWLLIAGIAYYLLARFGMALFALKPANITLIWLPAGLAMVMVLRWRWRALPAIFLASFTANFTGMATSSVAAQWAHTLVAAGADTLAGVLTARALQRHLPDGLRRAADLIPFGVRICLVPMTVTSLILVANLVMGGYISTEASASFFRMLLLADSLGILLVYPIYQGWQAAERPTPDEWQFVLIGAFVLAMILLGEATVLPGMAFLMILAILAIAFEVGLLGMAVLATPALLTVMILTARGTGVFVGATPEESNFRVLAFVFATALALLGVTLQSHALRRAERARSLWQEAAEHDALTGLLNRRGFAPRLQAELERSRRSGRPFAVAMVDIDRFKPINDTHGHEAGDAILVHVGQVLAKNCRGIDTVARYGGEEFTILLPETSAADAYLMLERVRRAIEESRPALGNGSPVAVTLSIGIASPGGDAPSAEALLAKADEALYAAKRQGRNRVVIHPESVAAP